MEILKTFTISDTLKCTFEDGQYGPFIRISRGKRWIGFSTVLWKLIVNHIHEMNSDNFHLSLTQEKEINTISYKDARYISFHHIKKIDNEVKDIYINFNKVEWEKFMSMQPFCHDVHKVTLSGDSMKSTELSQTQLRGVRKNNIEANNQAALKCEYCGDYSGYGETCHCHRYNCKECEPMNFCQHCDSLVVAV